MQRLSQNPDQQPCATTQASCFTAVSCDSRQGRGGTKHRRRNGCMSSWGQHNTVITSHTPPFLPPIPDAQNSQPRAKDLFFFFFFYSPSHFHLFPPVCQHPVSSSQVLYSLSILLSSLPTEPFSPSLSFTGSVFHHGVYADKRNPKEMSVFLPPTRTNRTTRR